MTGSVEPRSDYPPPGMELRLLQRFVEIKGRRVLEIGCGDRRLTRQLAPLASRGVAIEPDSAKIPLSPRLAAPEGIRHFSFRLPPAEPPPPPRPPFHACL